MLYSLGGYAGDKQQPINTLNTFNITSMEWSNVTVSGGNFNFNNRAATSRATSKGAAEALGFVSGGWKDLGGMIRFDASDAANPQWRNETNNNPPLSLEGSMQFIRLGPNGSLINFGGYNKDYINPKLTGWSFDHRPFEKINVYDIASSTWFNVTASGDIPSDRSAFCAVVSSAPDDSSFQITMYGGWDLFGGRSLADTYVLSIPAFQWINVTDSSNLDAFLAAGTDVSGRGHHQCAAYKERQMLVLGGILRIGSEAQNVGGCNKSLPALRALDLSTFKFIDSWNGSPEPYYVPDAVTRIIGGSGRGGATMKQPAGGFNDSALNSIFGAVSARYTPVISASSVQPGSGGGDPTPRKTNLAAIAGGVVGGVILLAIIAAIIFLVLRRRKQRVALASAAAAPSPSIPAGPAWDGRPQEMSHETRGPKEMMAEYHKPPIDRHSQVLGGGGYEPVMTQEMDAGYRGSEVMRDGRSRPVGELPA
jgi:hypothetical protein